MGAKDPIASHPLPPIAGDGVVGSITAHWKQWRALGAPRLVVQWLRGGVPLIWSRPPQPSRMALRKQQKELMEEMGSLVKSGAFIEEETEFVAPTFLILKRDGSSRLIHDLRGINKAIRPPAFTLRGAKDAASVVEGSNWLVSLDLMHGYQQVAMNKKARKYLGAQWGDRTVVSTVLPFGLNISPYIFTRLTTWLARQIRKRFNLNVAVYVDDFLLGADTYEKLETGVRQVEEFFKQLGVILSDKTSRHPSRRVEFLGFLWDASTKEISVTSDRRREYRREVKNLLRHPQTITVWRRVVGKLIFLRDAVGTTLRHTRSLMKLLRSNNKHGLIEATEEARQDLQWWEEKLRSTPRLSLVTKPVSAVITTDASDTGLGAVVEIFGKGSVEAEGNLSSTGKSMMATKSSNPRAHINTKEIEALLEALDSNKEKLRDKKVLWFTDNTTAKAAVARQGTQNISEAAWDMIKKVVDLAASKGIEITARLVPGRLNSGADKLSRILETRTEWEEALSTIALKWGPLNEDPCGFTGQPTSALETLEWANKRSLLVPSIKDIGSVVKLVAMVADGEGPDTPPAAWESMAVIVTPLWQGAVWWPLLIKMRRDFIYLGKQSITN